MSSSTSFISSSTFVISVCVFVGQVVFADDLKCSKKNMCPNLQACMNEMCVPCENICDSDSEIFSSFECAHQCSDLKPTKTDSVSNVLDVNLEDSKVQGTGVVATMLHENDVNTSTDLDVQENKESSGTVMSLGDMAAICGVIAFIIFCIGLRILTKEYPCPWFVTPKNTKPIKLEENMEELTDLNV
ncbi:uncharacterized protein [Antedon mediterranea]|uniref:uncharacterized protein n=1 Tax=Antedon mediterranea TaxID=105859 RepID=UPI003AF6B4B8